MAKRRTHNHGFTIVELLLVTALIALMGLSVYGTFANGMRIWKTVNEDTDAEDINIFLDTIAFDLRNSFKLTGMRFDGESNKVSFPGKMRYRDGEELKNTIGKITYYLNKRKNQLIRREANYSEVFLRKPGTEKIMSGHVSSLKFKYFIYDEQKKTYSWEDFWQNRDETFGIQTEEHLPLLVKVEVEVPVDNVREKFVKTVRIPSGCCWPFAEDQ